jgi:hypothetical protein
MYRCEFPNCGYKTKIRSQIDNHHIVPVELGGQDGGFNRILLCPNCHRKTYVPEARQGIHTVKGDDSIIILGWLNSTGGKVLEFVDSNNETQYYKYT